MKGMLSGSKLLQIVRNGFSRITDNTQRLRSISLTDHLMSGFAVFSLKYPSLLQFDRDSREKMIEHNLKSVYQIKEVPSDTHMRERLDVLAPSLLRKNYKDLFAQCQRSKRLELFKYYDDRYLMPLARVIFILRRYPVRTVVKRNIETVALATTIKCYRECLSTRI